jgi:hypothetical protein
MCKVHRVAGPVTVGGTERIGTVSSPLPRRFLQGRSWFSFFTHLLEMIDISQEPLPGPLLGPEILESRKTEHPRPGLPFGGCLLTGTPGFPWQETELQGVEMGRLMGLIIGHILCSCLPRPVPHFVVVIVCVYVCVCVCVCVCACSCGLSSRGPKFCMHPTP